MVVSESKPELPSMFETSDGDRPSVTDAGGTVARFEMAYSPEPDDRFRFGPPLSQRAGSLLFLLFALVLASAVLIAYAGYGPNGLLAWVVEGDKNRPLGSVPLSVFILLSAIGTVIRAGMRGVIVTAEGIEARYLLPMGVPRIRKWSWAQIDRLIVDEDDVMLELWNGAYEKLPRVRDGEKLGRLLTRIATARGRQVTRLADTRA